MSGAAFFTEGELIQIQERGIQIGSRFHHVESNLSIELDNNHHIYLKLANSVIDLFTQDSLISTLRKTLSRQDVLELVFSWSKPWRYYYLSQKLTKAERHLIILGNLKLQANKSEELDERYSQVRKKLATVDVPVDLSITGCERTKKHYNNLSDIHSDIKKNLLIEIQPNLVAISSEIIAKQGNYTTPKLAEIIHTFLKELQVENKELHAKLVFSSGTRDVETQELLVKLGYPAAKISYHTMGNAVDFKLSTEAKSDWNHYLKASGAFDKIDDLLDQNIQPSISNLVKHKIVKEDQDVARIHSILSNIEEIFVLDETPFFRNEKEGNTVGLSPVWHLQIG